MSRKTKIHGLENTAVYEKVCNIDLTLIHSRLMDNNEGGLGWSKEMCEKIEEQYKAFMFLCYSYPDKPIVPTHEIDEMWHAHILDTRKYANDCENTIGYFLHHFPYFGRRGEEDNQNWKESFFDTKTLFRDHFAIDLNFKAAMCNGGCSDDKARAAMCNGGCSDDKVRAAMCNGGCSDDKVRAA